LSLEYSPTMSDLADSSSAPTSSIEARLVAAARDGDRTAFGRLYERFSPMVHGVLLARIPRTEVDDLVQDVFLQAMKRLDGLRDPDAFGPWLAAIARNRASDFHRHCKPDVSLDEAPQFEKSAPPPLTIRQTSHSSAEARVVLEAIHSLPEAYREPLILRLVAGMTGPEIAARTGLTHGSVRVNLSRGMQQLREILNRKVSPASGGEL